MRQYYFTVSSLPYLRLDEAPGLTLDEFHAACEPWVSPQDLRLIKAADLDPTVEGPSSPVLDSWRGWERALRNELVRPRAQRLGWDPYEHLQTAPFVYGAAQLAQDALSADNPLEAEQMLMRARWSFLEELEVRHAFDVERLVVYSLKLRLLERRALLDPDGGRERFVSVFDALKGSILKKKITVGEG